MAAALLIPLFIAAGNWQWNKASLKAELQQQLEARRTQEAIRLSTTRVEPQAVNYRKVTARGHYEPQFQILIDNRTHDGQAGYHVITPLFVEGSNIRVLVNRGWIPALAEHRQVPVVETPTGVVDVDGTALAPTARFFTLASNTANNNEWQEVWQNLDLERYGNATNFPIQPVVIQLDAQSAAGGFVREWRSPDDRRLTNVGYAFQWWTFAATTLVLWLVLNVRQRNRGI